MIIDMQGDLFESGARALVNPVNCIGEMGKGLAAVFKKRFPENFYYYEKICQKGIMQAGKVLVVPLARSHPDYVINFPTKRHWKDETFIEDIENGLKHMVAEIQRVGIDSLALPALGCGLGGLDWNMVHPMIIKELEILGTTPVYLYGPQ